MIKNLRSSYKKYLETTENPVDIKTYLLINADYNKFLINEALQGNEITLPSRMGTIYIVGRKPTIRFDEDGKIVGLAPDWVETKKLWDRDPEAKAKKQRVFHTNSHSDGYRFKWNWSKNNVLVENKTLYSLRLTRDNKRIVNSLIEKGVQFITKN